MLLQLGSRAGKGRRRASGEKNCQRKSGRVVRKRHSGKDAFSECRKDADLLFKAHLRRAAGEETFGKMQGGAARLRKMRGGEKGAERDKGIGKRHDSGNKR